jgi:hypothetical protein
MVKDGWADFISATSGKFSSDVRKQASGADGNARSDITWKYFTDWRGRCQGFFLGKGKFF